MPEEMINTKKMWLKKNVVRQGKIHPHHINNRDFFFNGLSKDIKKKIWQYLQLPMCVPKINKYVTFPGDDIKKHPHLNLSHEHIQLGEIVHRYVKPNSIMIL